MFSLYILSLSCDFHNIFWFRNVSLNFLNGYLRKKISNSYLRKKKKHPLKVDKMNNNDYLGSVHCALFALLSSQATPVSGQL